MNHSFKLRPTIAPEVLALLVALVPTAAFAVGSALPSGGAILQQLSPITTSTPKSSGGALKMEQTPNGNLPSSAPFLVQSIALTGNKQIDTPTLLALVADAQGKTLTLPELGVYAARITAYYRNQDFPLVRAYIPAQTIAQGVVRIDVVEAQYGQINLENSSEVKYALLQATLSQLQNGEAIGQAKMDHVLLLLSDVPGVLVEATLKPGAAVGSSDFVVNTTAGPSAYGSLTGDDYGNRYTGRERLTGAWNMLNLLHSGDTLSANLLSAGSGMNYGRLGYEFLLNGEGTRLGGAYSTLQYVLGAPVTTDIHGTAQVSSLWAKHPFIRSRDVNLYGQIQYDGLSLRDFYSSDIQTDRSLSNWTLSVNGDTRDEWLAGGINSWSLGVASGRVAFDNAAAQSADAATANAQGDFSKWTANFVRLQALTPDASLYLTASGQWSDTNLDSSQKMSVGGPYTVRAYDMGALSGDSGYFLSAEYRHNLPPSTNGQWQLIAFLDSANVTFNSKAWSAVTGEGSGTLTGAGVGVNWSGEEQWNLKAHIATPIGTVPASLGSTQSTRVWAELGRKF